MGVELGDWWPRQRDSNYNAYIDKSRTSVWVRELRTNKWKRLGLRDGEWREIEEKERVGNDREWYPIEVRKWSKSWTIWGG